MLFKDVAALVIFCLVIIVTILLVLVPVSIKVPAWTKLPIKQLAISYAAVPVAGVVLMLCTGSLDGTTLAKGIVGDPNLKPYGIVILFLALAYISTSLDSTGCLGWLALHITRLSKGNGMALFMLYFGLSSLITIFTSNDVCIMTLTPIIYYFAVATCVDPVPFLTAEFTAANIWSMLLFVGNPTNIIVAMAYQMSFADYSRWMALPTLGAGLSCLAALLLVHYSSIPKRLTLPELQPSLMLVDKPGAVLGSINIVACLAFLAAAPALGWELWAVTLVCAGLHAIYNFTAYVVCKGRWCTQQQQQQEARETVAAMAAVGAGVPGGLQIPDGHRSVELVQSLEQQLPQQQQQPELHPACRLAPVLLAEGDVAPAAAPAAGSCKDASSDASHQDMDIEVAIEPTQTFNALQQLPVSKHLDNSSSHHANSTSGGAAAAAAEGTGPKSVQELLKAKQPTFLHVWLVLPWEVIPFVLGMFILVEGLNATGWVDRIALWLASAIHGNVWAALFGIGGFSVLLANLANNQPMTILMTRVTMSPLFTAAATAGASGVMASRVPQAAALAVVIASNVAANYTVMGALAGIMYVNILQRKGLQGVNYVTFSKLMLPAGLISTVVALAVLGAEYVTW